MNDFLKALSDHSLEAVLLSLFIIIVLSMVMNAITSIFGHKKEGPCFYCGHSLHVGACGHMNGHVKCGCEVMLSRDTKGVG